METSNWKKVKITDLFEIKSGVRLTKSNWGEPIYNYVGSSSINNGVTGKCNQWNYENIITMCSNGSVGYAFLQKGLIYVSDNCNVLNPKYKRSDYIDLFICTILTKMFTLKFYYGKPLNLARLSKESIYLPQKNDEIDWEWIEEFMEECKTKIPKLPKIKDGKNVNLDTSAWKSFNITDLFEIKKGSGTITNEGVFPLITASTANNGVRGKSSNYTFENCLTVSSNGAPGHCFYHNYKFNAVSDVNILIPKFPLSTFNGCFLATIITNSFTPKYNYGKKLNVKRLSKESVFLPAKNNEPDWEYMENFMNNLIEK